METDDDELFYLLDDEPELPDARKVNPWVVLIVDDDERVHDASKLFLGYATVHGKRFVSLSAYTGIEAKQILGFRSDIDLVFLDCVMETQDAGFEVAYFVKNVLKKQIPVIVMKSGFAGLGIEENLKHHPEIDEFVEKSKATSNVLTDILIKWLPKPE